MGDKELPAEEKLMKLRHYEQELEELHGFLSQKMQVIMGGRNKDYFDEPAVKESPRGKAYWDWYYPSINTVRFLTAIKGEIKRIELYSGLGKPDQESE